MGCGLSGPDPSKKKKKNDKLNTQLKVATLIFGMPDSGQNQAADILKKTFINNAFSQIQYVFNVEPTSREARLSWPQEYKSYENVLLSLFFADCSTPGSVLLSLKTLNWLTSQIDDSKKPVLVAKPRNQKEMTNVQTLKEQMPNNLSLLIIKDNSQQELQKLVDTITQAIQKQQTTIDK